MRGETKDGRLSIDADVAIAALPAGRDVHTFMQSGPNMLIGADWERAEIITALRGAKRIDITGEQAQSMEHGLAIEHPRVSGAWLFIQTRGRTDQPLEVEG